MFDLNRWTESADSMGDPSADSDQTCPVCHTNRRSIQNTIGVVMNCLVGMGL